MAVVLSPMALFLLLQGCLCSLPQNNTGCRKWRPNGDNVCCDICHVGNRLVSECGPKPEKLCTPCEAGTFTTDPKNLRCDPCTQCVGAHILLKKCTTSSDTMCKCKEGLRCGGHQCSFCVQECGKGQEPTEKRSCRPCPEGTFNNQIHQACKPWSTSCPNPGDTILSKGDAFSDMKCMNNSYQTGMTQKPEITEQAWPWLVPVIIGTALFCSIILMTVAWKIIQKKPEEEKEPEKASEKMIIVPPSDDPRTLIAIECSFHEAQQEQGSSTESLASKESSQHLLP